MGLTAAASVQKLSTDAVIAMAPALTEPVTQSDISGQSPRPGDSITSSPTTITENIAAAENQPNNGKYPPTTTVKPVNGVVKKQQQQLTDDLHTTTNGIEHMDQKISDNINNKYETIAAAATDQQNNDVTSTTRDDDGDQTLALVKVSDSQSSGMSMQNFTSKETAEVEQMLGDLAASGDIDLMSVFKTLESAPVSDAGFDLAGGLSLFNDVDVMNVYEETVPNTSPVKDPQISELRSDIEKRRQQMQRKCDFLLRRLRKLQARYMTQHASEEIVGLIEHCHRYNRRKEREIALGVKPPAAEPNLPDVMPYQPPPGSSSSSAADAKLMPVSGSAIRHIIKKLEEKATNQKATYSKRQLGVKYFQSAQEASRQAVANNNASSPGVTRPPANTNNFSYVHRFEDKVIDQVDQVAGLLHAELRMVERAIDSDATASSSGGESADEMVVYSNATQQNLQM